MYEVIEEEARQLVLAWHRVREEEGKLHLCFCDLCGARRQAEEGKRQALRTAYTADIVLGIHAPRLRVWPRQQVLYRFYNSRDELLYIGITGDLRTRIQVHKAQQPWWQEVSSLRIQVYEDRPSVRVAEKLAIRDEHPRYNRVHNRGLTPAPPAV